MLKYGIKLTTLMVVFAAFLAVSLTAYNGDFLSEKIVRTAFQYYGTPYPYKAQLDKVSRKVGNRIITVERPNHALLHALRKAALAYYTVEILRDNKQHPLGHWINYFTKSTLPSYNRNFEDQLAFGMLMLRTGRSSESNKLYLEDAYASAKYFVNEAEKTGFFPNKKDIDDYEFAFQTIGDSSKCFNSDASGGLTYSPARGCTTDRLYLYNFLYGIHHIDLRRMTSYDKNQILGNVARYLGFADINDPDLQKIWDYEGSLLWATGDTDMDTKGSRWGNYADAFFLLSNDPVSARAKIAELHDLYISEIKKLKAQSSSTPPVSTPPSSSTPPPAVVPQPLVIEAKADKNDPYFAYTLRPTITEALDKKLYPQEVIDRVDKHKKYMPLTSIPWTFVNLPEDDLNREKLAKIVPDRWVDPQTGKRYVVMYHGTTSDLIDIFKQGEKVVRYDVATNKVLGMGFYLTANVNEAKMYACWRLKERKAADPSLKAMVAMFGIEENDLVQGRISPQAHLSDDKTGEPLNIKDYFKRNSTRLNQFNFFKNVQDYLKLVRVILLPQNFEMAEMRTNNDYDGQTDRKVIDANISKFTCPY